MNGITRLAIATTMCLMLSPSTAWAGRGGFWEFLEQLSGPGPFTGVGFDVPLVCDFVNKDKPDDPGQVETYRCLNKRLLGEGGAVWRRRAMVSLSVGRLTSGENGNDLIYPVEPVSRDIVWWHVGPALTWHANEFFDLHTSLEWNRLSSPDDVFEPISVTSVELLGITWRPGARSNSPILRSLIFPLKGRLLTKGFTAEQFGAIPGTFESRPEIQFQLGIGVDFWEF